MRRLLLILGPVVLSWAPAVAQPDSLNHQFETATAAYKQGQYARAVDGYRALLDAGHASAALYYNLGNAYVRLDRLGPAIRYYEKARNLRPSDPRLQHNLEQARRQAGVYPGRLPPRGLHGLVQHWSPLGIFVAGLLLLTSSAAIAVVWARHSTAVRHPLVWGPAVAGFLLVTAAFGTSYVQSTQQRAVVVTPRTPLHSAPGPSATSDTTLSEGTLLNVQTRRPRWTEVRLADGTVGWVPARTLGDV